MATVQAVLLVLFVALFFYRFGAGNLEGLMNYPFWRDMGRMMSNDDFVKLRAVHLWKVFPLLVIPFALQLPVTAALIFLTPPSLPVWPFVVAFILLLIAGASTVLIQVPIQLKHNSGYDAALFDRLIVTDFWLRKVPSFLEAAVVTYVLWLIAIRA